MPARELNTTDILGARRQFYYESDVSVDFERLLKYRIMTRPEDVYSPVNHFQFDLKQIGAHEYKVETMSGLDNAEFLQKGIPDAMIAQLGRDLGAAIVSSTNIEAFQTSENESRNVAASKVWRRMRVAGIAGWDGIRGRYFLLQVPTPVAELNLPMAQCRLCLTQIPVDDMEGKVDHSISRHPKEKIPSQSMIEFANQIFP